MRSGGVSRPALLRLRWADSRAGLPLPGQSTVSEGQRESQTPPAAHHSLQGSSLKCLQTANISSSEEESSLGARSRQVSLAFHRETLSVAVCVWTVSIVSLSHQTET